jgi:large subunit ribosomal protein L21|tara:strand:- start:318 stop:719 length:402 start_codon:yes stop_codon:yes gene_type:complete
MFAVIKTGGKQYKVAKDDVLLVEKLSVAAGDKVSFDEVLLIGDDESSTAGAPLVAGASVSADVVEQTRGDKVIIFKKSRRKHYRRKNGHRQELTVVKITDILAGGPAKAKTAAKKAPAKKAAAAEAPAEKTEE